MKIPSAYGSPTYLLSRFRLVVFPGLGLGLFMLILHWLEIRLVWMKPQLELYTGAIALLFAVLGFWFARKIWDKPPAVSPTPQKISLPTLSENQVFLSPREREVLLLMAHGKTNQEIANQLFVSSNTVKTHTSRLYEKLEVRRRTEAIQKARELGVLT